MSPPPVPARLTDGDDATAMLRDAGLDIARAHPAYVRYKPDATTIVAYRLDLPDGSDTWGHVHWCDDPERISGIHHKARSLRPRPSAAGPGLVRLDPHTVLSVFPNDARLRRLRWYTDPRKLKRSLGCLAGTANRVSGSRTKVAVLRYKPERRVVARVDLASTGPTRTVLVRYSTHRRATLLAGIADHLRDHGIDVPAPIAQLDDDRVGVDEFVDGDQLAEAVRAGGIETGAVATATVRFHDTPPPPGVPRRCAVDDLARAVDGLGGVGRMHPHLRAPARAAAALLERRLPDRSGPVVLLHGDLHAKNVIVRRGGVVFIDLERVAVGPAAIDVGFFLAHSLALGIRRPGWSPDAAVRATEVADLYRAARGGIAPDELAWHTALGLVEQAILVARHLESGWRHSSVELLELAGAQLSHRPVTTARPR